MGVAGGVTNEEIVHETVGVALSAVAETTKNSSFLFFLEEEEEEDLKDFIELIRDVRLYDDNRDVEISVFKGAKEEYLPSLINTRKGCRVRKKSE